jgi:large subunit ribosomal protein L10
MPSQKNVDQLTQLKEKLTRAQNVIVANYAGLNSASQTELRAKVKAAGGEFTVTKNRLIKIALTEKIAADLPNEFTAALEGPNATIFGFSDPVAATKVLIDFAKTNEALELKIGMLVGTADQTMKVLSIAELKTLAQLPSRQQLLAQLVGQLNAPVTGFVNVLSGNLRGLVQVLNAIKDNKNTN